MATFTRGYALIVGVSQYQSYPEASLPSVLSDTADMCWTLRNPNTCAYPNDQVRYLLDSQATAAGICEGLEWLADRVDQSSTAIFYFSGHGLNRINSTRDDSCLVAYDADLENGTGIVSGTRLSELLRSVSTGRLAVFLDSCYAGGTAELKSKEAVPEYGALGNRTAAGLSEGNYQDILKDGRGRVIIASSGPDQISFAPRDLKHSLFTHYLLKALQGEARATAGTIRVFEVFNFIEGNMSRHTRNRPLLKTNTEKNFPLALAQHPKLSLDSLGRAERRSGNERRSTLERRGATPLQRLRYGFWRDFHFTTGEGQDDNFWNHLDLPSSMIRTLEKEAGRYVYLDAHGNPEEPAKVLKEAVNYVFDYVKSVGGPCKNIIGIEEIATRIGDIYRVEFRKRRSDADRREARNSRSTTVEEELPVGAGLSR